MNRLVSFYRLLIAESREWIYFILAIAVAGLAGGAVTVLFFPQTIPPVFNFLKDTFKEILGPIDIDSGLPLAQTLLRQNFLASIYDLAFGAILGILPLLSIAGNFFILGFLGGFSFVSQIPQEFPEISFGYFLLSILPHGIFEIPALILAAAFGLRLGWQWLLPSARGKRGGVFKAALLDSLRLVPLIFALLIIAALVEAFITPALIR